MVVAGGVGGWRRRPTAKRWRGYQLWEEEREVRERESERRERRERDNFRERRCVTVKEEGEEK